MLASPAGHDMLRYHATVRREHVEDGMSSTGRGSLVDMAEIAEAPWFPNAATVATACVSC